MKITKKAFVRRQTYYDEDVEDCFDQKDDIIDLSLLSSDDEPPKKDKLKGRVKIYQLIVGLFLIETKLNIKFYVSDIF